MALVGAWLAACGGKAVIDPDTSSADGGNGGDTPVITTSVGGAPTSTVTTGGTECTDREVTCPDEPPTAGSSCRCAEGLYCEYDMCLTEGLITGFQCDENDATWLNVTSSTCPQPVCPNNMFCNIGEVCLIVSTGFQVTFSCAPNICAPTSPPNCECAADLCGDDGDFVCVTTTETSVTCECTNC